MINRWHRIFCATVNPTVQHRVEESVVSLSLSLCEFVQTFFVFFRAIVYFVWFCQLPNHTHTAVQCECAFTLLYMVIAVNYIMCIILMIEGWRWPFAYRLLCWSAWSCPTGWHNQPNGLVTHLHCRFLVFIRSSHVRGPVIGDQIDYTCIGGHIGASWYFFFSLKTLKMNTNCRSSNVSTIKPNTNNNKTTEQQT